jgi:hypothetical protein
VSICNICGGRFLKNDGARVEATLPAGGDWLPRDDSGENELRPIPNILRFVIEATRSAGGD